MVDRSLRMRQTALLQLGSLLQLQMYGTASSTKLQLVTSLGATPIDYHNEDFIEHLQHLAVGGVDAVVVDT